MKASDLFSVMFVFFVFFTLNLYIYVMLFMNEIKENWPVYRCNPTVMPFASYFGFDPVENFGKCIQRMQAGFMQEFLAPVYHVLNTMGDVTGNLMDSISDVKGFGNNLQSGFGKTSGSMFGVLDNVKNATAGIMVGVMDTFARLGGVLRAIFEMFEAFLIFIKSGAVMFCFHPDTLVSMADGSTKKMSEIDLGEELDGNRTVVSTMKLRPLQKDREKYYAFQSKKTNQTILVTGGHFVEYDNGKTKRMVPVKEHPDAKETDKINDDMVCLITDDNRIPIGEYLFCDWEDDEISRKYHLSEFFY